MRHLYISSFEMKRFLKNIVWCSIPIMVFLGVVEFVVRSFPNDFKYKWSYLENHSSEIEVLVLGNSHTANGVDCWILPNSFNMAMGGQGVMMDEYILESFLDKMQNLRAVVMPMTYPTLNMPLAFGTPDRLMQYHIYYQYDPKWYSKDDYECLNFLSCSKKIRTLLKGESLVTIDSLGCDKVKRKGFDDISEETLSWMSGRNLNTETVNMVSLGKMVELCEDKDVSLVLISIPVDISFRENELFNNEQIKMVKDVARDLSEDYANIYWIDWYDNPKFSTSDFYNSDHLNEYGALKLTNMLKQFLVDNGII